MKKLATLFIGIGLFSSMNITWATDLVDVFQQAQASDPTYQQAKANYLATRATLGEAFAAFLPNLSLTGSWTRQDTTTDVNAGYPNTLPGTTTGKLDVETGELTLSQNLFNWASFKTYAQTKLSVKQAAATYAAAEQDLILRTAQAYFSVLTAEEVLRYTAIQKEQLEQSLKVAEARYHVGLEAVTSVYDAQAQYDSTVATYISNQNNVADQKEALREITNQLYPSLAQLKDQLPLIQPVPADIDEWTKTAENQNSSLMAARFAAQAAEQNVKVQFAGHLPTVALNGNYTNTNDVNIAAGSGNSDAKTSSIGATLNVPLFSGGNVHYQTQQAQHQYEAALAQAEITHRSTVASVRQSYLGVVAEISQIQADQQAIKSGQASLDSNLAAYKVGTRTILDVLNAQTTLYQAETTYAQDRYQYIVNYLTLKQAAGTLSVNDIAEINTWLKSDTTIPMPHPKEAPHVKETPHVKAAPHVVAPVAKKVSTAPQTTSQTAQKQK